MTTPNVREVTKLKHVLTNYNIQKPANRYLYFTKFSGRNRKILYPWRESGEMYTQTKHRFEGIPIIGGERLRWRREWGGQYNTIHSRYSRNLDIWWPGFRYGFFLFLAFAAYDQFIRGPHTAYWGHSRHWEEI